MITGSTENSGLVDFKKYVVGATFGQQYFGGGNWEDDGVDYSVSDSDYIVYFIGGIRFVDETIDEVVTTTFSYLPNNEGNFTSLPIIKDPNKSKLSANIKVSDDVFIVRDSLSIFDKNYRLEYINRLIDLTTYAGGRYFTIINNT